ncbi:pentatricopeptide repeat-containing protein At5g06540-like [Arachis ipaensis]|uniref:pentatricopeptide repeat-containing protein At5g06540-like n=1 Tax=Arachis ipaensis TaxID=130454 RepID=UPI0007AF1CB9|nr:pentatricopeptide repeat-containing protein At5g06540-like [Arachis ipaensis]
MVPTKLHFSLKHRFPRSPPPPRTFSTIPLPPPTPPSLSLLADQCTTIHHLKQVHAQLILTGRIRQDPFAASRLLSSSALSPFADLTLASRIFSSLPYPPNTFMWNTLIRAHASSPNPHYSLCLYVSMRKLGAIPGKHTFPFLLKACSNIPSLPACTQVHTHVLKFGLSFDSHVANGLVKGYSVSGDFARARLMFDEMPDRSLSLWTTMVCGYAQNQCYDEALGLFDEMIEDGLEPNAATLASVLSACARAGYLELGQRIHEFMKVKGFEVKVILGTALVYMYAKNGEIVMARKLFDEMTERNVVTWNVMISGLAAHGHVEDALGLFEKLKEEQAVVPNNVTFLGVLSACCHAGLVDVGREIFYSMKNVYGVDAKIEHYGCMVDLLGKEGKLLEAEELVKGMPWKPDIVILGALLAACKNNGNTKVAKRVVKEILALEPHNHGVHVAMSNIYAEAGQWNEVLRLRKVMKEERLKKTPGWSLVAT